MQEIDYKEIYDLLAAGDAELVKYNSIAVCEYCVFGTAARAGVE